MKFFGLGSNAAITMGAAMMALIGAESVSAEQIDAANQELDAAGLKGAQLVPGATLEELMAKADRTDKAEQSATDLQGKLDAANLELGELRKKPGAEHTSPNLAGGKTDIEGNGPDENQKAIDALPHNVALDNNPLFGKRVEG